MPRGKSILQQTNTSRLLKDKLAKYGVMTGGVMVLCALLLLFFYLLYVVAPVFQSAHIKPRQSSITTPTQYSALGIEEQSEFVYAITDSGQFDFYSLAEQRQIKSYQSQLRGDPIAFSQSIAQQSLYAFTNNSGQVTVVKPFFKVDFTDGKRQQIPVIHYPFGKQPVQLDNTEVFTVEQLALAQDEDTLGILYQTQDHRSFFTKIEPDKFTFLATPTGKRQTTVELVGVTDRAKYLFLSPDLTRAFMLTDTSGFVFNLSHLNKVELLYQFSLDRRESHGAELTAANLHSGANSILLGYSDGKIEQWFESIEQVGRNFVKARTFTFDTDLNTSAISSIEPEYYRRSFIATNQAGEANLFHTTAEAKLWTGKLAKVAVENLSFSPRANALVYSQGKQLMVANVDNEHPEVTWSGLWQQVWYEGYPEPSYTWQSSSASDDFEPKFSLVPITFGTIKAALYAMLFAVPIGLAAAIYTAYFMAPKARQIVKPTVEIMEALPTVILGFLAGLWLAPLVEARLSGFVMGLILLPVGILLTAMAWHKLPNKIKNNCPPGWEPILLLPIISLTIAFCYLFSPTLELWLFNGDTRQYITNNLGLSFDQRNALIVGIAMGFAVIPTVFSIAEDAIFNVPKTLSNGSLALGATHWQTLTRVVLLTASPGIFSAVMMGLGRAVGETMIVLMATGNTPLMDWSVLQGMRTLSANIAVEMPESEVGSSHYRILFLAAFVLFIFTFVFNTIAEFVRQRLREKYSSL